MEIRGIDIRDTFAEAFRMWACRLVVTAIDERWVRVAAGEVCGYGTSVIGCDTEAAVERMLDATETPDGRPGASLLFFAFNAKALAKAIPNRVGQCLMTCPTTAVYDGMPEVSRSDDSERLNLGNRLRYFGDGFQRSKVLDGRRYWRIPVMEGEFLVEATFGAVKAIGGGNFLLGGRDQRAALDAAMRAVDAVAELPDVIMPFPGGVVRSGSKVGSRYKALFASSNDAHCPTLRTATRSELPEAVRCVFEIVINGLSAEAIAEAMRRGIAAACEQEGLIEVSAGNYGGNLGKFHFRLHEVMSRTSPPTAPPTATQPAGVPASRAPRGYVLTWKPQSGPQPVCGAVFRPDTLGAMPPGQLAEQTLAIGREKVALKELFEISGAAGETLTLRRPPRLDRLGAQMASGMLRIEGDAGDDLGASMRGGLIHVSGNVGHRVAGPDTSRDRGATGGSVVVLGDAGDFAGLRLRRGLVLIAGRAGRSPGYRMLAGSLIVMRGPYDAPGLEMRRGSIFCLDAAHPVALLPGMSDDGIYQPSHLTFMRVLLTHLRRLDLPPQVLADLTALDDTPHRLLRCDAFELHKGELWQPVPWKRMS